DLVIRFLLFCSPLHSAVSTSHLLFFHSSGAHRFLHSFPTRRSSDLNSHLSRLQIVHTLLYRVYQTAMLANVLPTAQTRCARITRSEEHTSELQSRFDLVCRLLLEKKKINSVCNRS